MLPRINTRKSVPKNLALTRSIDFYSRTNALARALLQSPSRRWRPAGIGREPMNQIKRNRKRTLRRGATTVELAVCAPVMLLMMLFSLEAGYAFMVKQSITLAANAASRTATLPGATSDDVHARVNEVLENSGLKGYDVTTNIDELDPLERQVSVEVSIPLHRVLFTGKMLGGETWTITSKKISSREMDPNYTEEGF